MTVKVTKLDNGLRVATDTMDSVETVSLGTWIGVGTRHERPEVNGVAHFLEHMVFKGTRRRSARDIAEQIEAVGGHINAYTGRENTAFYAKVLAEDSALALDILSDILQHSVFDQGELARERAVILQEIGQAADTPDDIVFDHFQETAYPSQAIGRPVLGRSETVSALDRRTLMDYLARHYGPDDMVVAAAGRIEHAWFCEAVSNAFDALPLGGGPAPEPAVYRGGDRRETRDLEQVHLILGLEGVGYHDPDYYGSLVLSTLLGGGMSSRLFQEVREERGLAYAIYSFVSAYHDGGLFGVYAGTGEADVSELLSVVAENFAKLPGDITDEELDRARAQLKASVLMSRENSLSRCEQLAQNLLVYGRPVPLEEIVQKIEAVDIAGLGRVVGRMHRTQPSLAVIGPTAGVDSFESLRDRLTDIGG
ncbi:MAG: pitrilysin family protein [Kiloniellales bacterium]|nr:pitrilysin family protein [Kiloniellales bacterium]